MIGERVSWCLCTRGKVIHLCAVHRAIKLLGQPMKVLGESWKRGSDVRCQLITCKLSSCLAREALIPLSSCDNYQ